MAMNGVELWFEFRLIRGGRRCDMSSLLEEAALGVDEALDWLAALDFQLALFLMDQIQIPIQLDF